MSFVQLGKYKIEVSIVDNSNEDLKKIYLESKIII